MSRTTPRRRSTGFVVFVLVGVWVGSAACRRPVPSVCPGDMTLDKERSKPGQFVWCRDQARKSARYIDFHPGGKGKRQICDYRDGKPEGPFAATFADGKPWIAGQYAAGNPDGRWTQWDGAGHRMAEGEYRGGRFVAGAPVAGMAVCEKLRP